MEENKSVESSPDVQKEPPVERPQTRWRVDMLIVGLILIGLGALLLAAALNPDLGVRNLIMTYWPLLIVAAGLVKIVQAFTGAQGRGSGLGLLIVVVVILIIAAATPWDWVRIGFDGNWWFLPDHVYVEDIELLDEQVLEIKAYEGRILAYGHSDDHVTLRVKTYVSGWSREKAEEVAEEFRARINRTDEVVQIVTDPRRHEDGKYRLRVMIEVGIPDNAEVRIIGDRSRIDLEDINANISVESRYGYVDVERADGNIKINIKNANVDVEYLNAELFIEGDRTNLELDEIYGDITIKLGHGRVELDNDHRVTGNMDISNDSGRIELDLNEFSEIDVNATTRSGRIGCDFQDTDRSGLKELRQAFNGGGYRVDLFTDNGSIWLESD